MVLLVAVQATSTWVLSIAAFSHLKLATKYVQNPSFGYKRHSRQRLASTTDDDSLFDMEELQQRMRYERQKSMQMKSSILQGCSQWSSQQTATPMSPKSTMSLDFVYIVTFPETTNQESLSSSLSLQQPQNGGIHSIECPSGGNIILAFTNQKSCDNFVLHLRRQQFFEPTVCSFDRA
jgi:hypothetical protein